MGVLDKVAKSMNKSIEYRQGYEAGKLDGEDIGFKKGYSKAEKKYKVKDFYDPLGEEA